MRLILFFLATLLLADSLFAASTLYDQPQTFLDENREKTKLSRWKGQFSIVTIAYTSCPSTCSFTIANLKKIENGLTTEHFKPEFLVFTIDPNKDTPTVLTRFEKEKGLLAPQWHFLTGSEQDVRKALGVLDLNFGTATAAGTHITHLNVLILLGRDGKVLKTVTGTEPDLDGIKQLLLKPIRQEL
jgi:protein SCO1